MSLRSSPNVLYSRVSVDSGDEDTASSTRPTRRVPPPLHLADDSSRVGRWLSSNVILLGCCFVFAFVTVFLVLGSSSHLPILGPSKDWACGSPAVLNAALEPALAEFTNPVGMCMLIRAYSRNFHYVPTLMSLLRHNTHPPKLFFHVTDLNSSNAELARWVARGNKETGFRFGRVLNVSEEAARRDFPELGRVPEYGFSFTDAAMELMTTEAEYRDECQWLLMTNVDNIYGGYFLDRVEQEIAKGYQLIGFNMISHYDWVTLRGSPRDTRDGSSDDGTRRLLDIEWKDGFIDLGAVVFNMSMWKSLNCNFIQLGLNTPLKMIQIADGQFIIKMVESGIPHIAIRQVMYMHQ